MARAARTEKASVQRALELQWLEGSAPRSILHPHAPGWPPRRWKGIAKRVADVLRSGDLDGFLALLADRNARKPAPFLVGPKIFQTLRSQDARRDARAMMPVLGETRTEVRDDMQNAAAKCTALAGLLRRLPRQHVVLGSSAVGKWLSVVEPLPVIRAVGRRSAITTVDALLVETAAALRKIVGERLGPAPQQDLRSLVARSLVQCFRKRLGSPYHSHVATITTLVSGVDTDTDYVKKIDGRSRGDKTT
jgi:hypothetical protein